MLIESLIIGIFIAVAAAILGYFQKSYHLKPRPADYSVTVTGRTEDAETVQITFPLCPDEKVDWQAKLDGAFKIREDRLSFQNQRMLDLQKQAEETRKAAREAKIELVKNGSPEEKEVAKS